MRFFSWPYSKLWDASCDASHIVYSLLHAEYEIIAVVVTSARAGAGTSQITELPADRLRSTSGRQRVRCGKCSYAGGCGAGLCSNQRPVWSRGIRCVVQIQLVI